MKPTHKLSLWNKPAKHNSNAIFYMAALAKLTLSDSSVRLMVTFWTDGEEGNGLVRFLHSAYTANIWMLCL